MFKKLFFISSLLVPLTLSSVAYAKWTKVTQSNGDIYYVDFERIKKHDGKVYFWELGDLLKPTKSGLHSAKIYYEANCERFGYRSLNQSYYNGPFASGKVLHETNTPEKDWRYPDPDSIGETILKAVCNHKSMQ